MANESTAGGYILPAGAPPVDDAELDTVLQKYVVGVTGLLGMYVRPRWQQTVPKQPAPDVNWCAIGVSETDRDPVAAVIHSGDGDGNDTLYRNEVMHILASFYGPGAKGCATLFADGIQIPQNQEVIAKSGLAFVDSDRIISAPELVSQQWIKRYDITLRLRRQVLRTYAVQNVETATVGIKADDGLKESSVSV
jgi:hypothetical protein